MIRLSGLSKPKSRPDGRRGYDRRGTRGGRTSARRDGGRGMDRRAFPACCRRDGHRRCDQPLGARPGDRGGAQPARARAAPRDAYDYIVVGAGAAGCIIAARLAAAGAEVLLVEFGWHRRSAAGDDARHLVHQYRRAARLALHGRPPRRRNNRAVPMAMGHVLGGGTSINAMLWVRGFAQDFDDWAVEWLRRLGLSRPAADLQARSRIGKAAPTNGAASAARSTSAPPPPIPTRPPPPSSRQRATWACPSSTT